MLGCRSQDQLRFFSDFDPFCPAEWSPLDIMLAPFGAQGSPGAPKGASRAPPGRSLGPQGSPEATPRPLRPRPSHQNDLSGIDWGALWDHMGQLWEHKTKFGATCQNGWFGRSLPTSILDAFRLRFDDFWCSEIKCFYAKEKNANSTGIPSKSR